MDTLSKLIESVSIDIERVFELIQRPSGAAKSKNMKTYLHTKNYACRLKLVTYTHEKLRTELVSKD